MIQKHIHCDGARYHVIVYDTNGTKCSEPDCEINEWRRQLMESKRITTTNFKRISKAESADIVSAVMKALHQAREQGFNEISLDTIIDVGGEDRVISCSIGEALDEAYSVNRLMEAAARLD